MKKIKQVILIDDQEITNFYNTYVLSQSNLVEKISVCKSTLEAIQLIQNLYKTNTELKRVIVFLDINLPGNTGFEFIRKNQSLFLKTKEKGLRLFILSSSSHTKDIENARNSSLIEGMFEKPLTTQLIEDLL